MAIRYDKKLNQEINRTIKNFNQKIARLEKQERELLPSKITKKDLKSSVYTRTELRRKLKELQRFSTRGAEDAITTSGGVKLTQYELSNIKRENARVKRNITREINRLKVEKPKIFGKTQTSTFSEMGDTDYLNLVARRKALEKNIDKLSREEFERFTKLIEKTGKNQQYMNNIFKQNYFEMLTDLAYYFDYDNDKLNILKQKLMNLKPNDFLKLFKDDKSIRAILDYYPVVTNSFNAINPDDIKEDVINLYDILIDNIDEIIQDYA
jgi:integrase